MQESITMKFLTVNFHQNKDENGSAMVSALLIMMLMLVIVSTMTTFAITGITKGSDIKEINQSQLSADSAVSNALYVANNPNVANGQSIQAHIGVANSVFGVIDPTVADAGKDGQYKWRWYAETVPTTFAGLAYDIYATGYKLTPTDKSSRTFRVRITSMQTEGATYEPTGPAYKPTPTSVFSWGVLGVNGVSLDNTSRLYSYNSQTVSNPTLSDNLSHGRAGSNRAITYGTGSVFNNLSFLANNKNNPVDTNRCSGSRCTNAYMTKYSYGIYLSSLNDYVDRKCPNSTYPDWIASQKGGVYNPSTDALKCWGNVVFDVNTSVPSNFSSGNPAFLYAKGNVTVKPGVQVNTAVSTDGGPLKFRIYSRGGNTGLIEAGSSINPTKFVGLLEGSALKCDAGKDTTAKGTDATTIIYGALACDTVVMNAGSTLWWDEQTSQIAGDTDVNTKFIWSAVSYDEVQ